MKELYLTFIAHIIQQYQVNVKFRLSDNILGLVAADFPHARLIDQSAISAVGLLCM